MPDAYTRADSLGVYYSVDIDGTVDVLGAARGGITDQTIVPIVTTPIPAYTYGAFSGAWGETDLTVTANDDGLRINGGAPFTIVDGETYLYEDPDNANKWIRIYKDAEYGGSEVGSDIVRLRYGYNTFGGGAVVSGALGSARTQDFHYLIFTNQNKDSKPITDIKLNIEPYSTTGQPCDVAQLPGAGGGTVGTSGSFASWPNSGYALVRASSSITSTIRGALYYASRTDTVLNVVHANHRFTTMVSSDYVWPIPSYPLAYGVADSATNLFTTLTTNIDGLISPPASPQITELLHRRNFGVRTIRYVEGGATGTIDSMLKIRVTYTVDGVEYTNIIAGRYLLANASNAVTYSAWVGEDGAEPDTTAAADVTSATLPMTVPLAPPVSGTKEYKVLCRYKDKYNRETKNIYSRRFVIDDNGDDVTETVTAPRDVTLTNVGSGKLQVTAYYDASVDSSPADTWLLYWTKNGVDPDPATDTPISVAMDNPVIFSGSVQLNYTTAAIAYGSDYRVIVRAQRSGDSVESPNTNVTSEFIDSVSPAMFSKLKATENYSHNNGLELLFETEHSLAHNIYTRSYRGMTTFHMGAETVFRAIALDSGEKALLIPEDWGLINDTVGGASGNNGVEVVDVNTVYIALDDVRIVKIDKTAKTVTCATFVYDGTITDDPTPSGEHIVTLEDAVGEYNEFCFSVFNDTRNRWEPAFRINTDGHFVLGYPVVKWES